MNTNTIGSTGFHHVAVNARDFDASITFYRDGLGFPLVREWTGGDPALRGAMLDAGHGSMMEVFEQPGWAADVGPIIHLAFRVSDTAAAHAAARAAGAREKLAPKEIEIPSDPPLAATISFVVGPDGEEIEFFQER